MDDSTTVEKLRALGDPVRWSIVSALRGGTCCACELARVADVSAPLLSHHLKVLRKAGLITGARRGRWIEYTLDDGAMESLVARLEVPAGDEVVLSGRGS